MDVIKLTHLPFPIMAPAAHHQFALLFTANGGVCKSVSSRKLESILPYFGIIVNTCFILSFVKQDFSFQEQNKRIGDNIACLRKQKGLTQEQLANKLNIRQTLLSKYETDSLQVSAEMIIRLATALDVDANRILGMDTNNSSGSSPSLKIMRRLQAIEKLTLTDQKALLRTIDKYIQNL